jgi:hypothetical protein
MYVRMYVYVYMRVCVCVCMYVYMYVCMCVCVCGFVTTLCKHQAKVTQNLEKEHCCATGKAAPDTDNINSRFKLA